MTSGSGASVRATVTRTSPFCETCAGAEGAAGCGPRRCRAERAAHDGEGVVELGLDVALAAARSQRRSTWLWA